MGLPRPTDPCRPWDDIDWRVGSARAAGAAAGVAAGAGAGTGAGAANRDCAANRDGRRISSGGDLQCCHTRRTRGVVLGAHSRRCGRGAVLGVGLSLERGVDKQSDGRLYVIRRLLKREPPLPTAKAHRTQVLERRGGGRWHSLLTSSRLVCRAAPNTARRGATGCTLTRTRDAQHGAAQHGTCCTRTRGRGRGRARAGAGRVPAAGPLAAAASAAAASAATTSAPRHDR